MVGTPTPTGPRPPSARDGIGWFRGIATGVAILVVGLGVSVGAANEILTNVSGMSRDNLHTWPRPCSWSCWWWPPGCCVACRPAV